MKSNLVSLLQVFEGESDETSKFINNLQAETI